MRKIQIAAAVAALLVCSAGAMAKPDDKHGGSGSSASSSHAGTTTSTTSKVTTTTTGSGKHDHHDGGSGGGGVTGGGHDDKTSGKHHDHDVSTGGGHDDHDKSTHHDHDTGGHDHGGMGGDHDKSSHHDHDKSGVHASFSITGMHNYHRAFSAHHRYHIGVYREPHGYAYRRWNYGERLPGIYFTQDYWLTDYSDYGLQMPPDGYVWVRFGPDAILIDQSTGEIVEVVYGQFY